jgi:hypothetical protein
MTATPAAVPSWLHASLAPQYEECQTAQRYLNFARQNTASQSKDYQQAWAGEVAAQWAALRNANAELQPLIDLEQEAAKEARTAAAAAETPAARAAAAARAARLTLAANDELRHQSLRAEQARLTLARDQAALDEGEAVAHEAAQRRNREVTLETVYNTHDKKLALVIAQEALDRNTAALALAVRPPLPYLI